MIVDIVNKYLCVYYVDFFYLKDYVIFASIFSDCTPLSHFRRFYLQKFIVVFIYSTFAVLLYVL